MFATTEEENENAEKKLTLGTAFAALAAGGAFAADINVKLGVLNDRSGIYSDIAGEGSVIAARLAVEDFKAAEKGSTLKSFRLTTRTSQMSDPTSHASGMIRTV